MPQATFSLGGKGATCQSCPNSGTGFTTVPKSGASSSAACVCQAGFGMSEPGVCKRCPPGTYSLGGSRDECAPCPFGTVSGPGARNTEECRPKAQLCPVGQTAPQGAVSREECGCYPGYGGGLCAGVQAAFWGRIFIKIAGQDARHSIACWL